MVAMKSIGQQLREARLARKMTLEAASKATKIKVEQLMELENNNYSRFAAPAYARGFIRIYARALGLDEHRLIDQLDGFINEQDEEIFLNSNPVNYIPEETGDKHLRFTKREIGMMIAGGIMLCIIGILLYKVFWVDLHTPGTGLATRQIDARSVASTPIEQANQSEERVAPAAPVNPWSIPRNSTEVASGEEELGIPRALPLNPALGSAVGGNAEGEPIVARAIPVGEVVGEGIVAPRAQPVNPSVGASSEVKPSEAGSSADGTASAKPGLISSGLRQLTLETSEHSWVRVTEVTSGKAVEVFSDVMEPGERRQFQAERFVLTFSVPAAVKVSLDGKELGVLSEERSPMEFQIPKAE